jgi:hypothetical protein
MAKSSKRASTARRGQSGRAGTSARRSRKAATATARTAKKTAKTKKARTGARPAAQKASSAGTRPRAARAKPAARKAGGTGKAATARQAGAARTTTRTTPARPVPQAASRATGGATRPSTRSSAPARRPPTLDRARRTIAEAEPHGVPSSLDFDRRASSVRTGHEEYVERLRHHTSTGPALTGGDVDADWEDAESVGEEAPGGDNPTPDQDVVDEIGRALGVEYEDDQELQGGEEIAERDRRRWELDPASREDYDEE